MVARSPSMGGKRAFLPAGITTFLQIRLRELVGLSLVTIAVLAMISLCSYHQFDPSFNVAIEESTRNILAAPGAYFADFALQNLGISIVLLILALAVWGIRLMIHYPFSSMSLRITMLVFALLLGSISFATVPSPFSKLPFLGGAIGHVLMTNLMYLLESLNFYGLKAILGGIFFALSIMAYNYSLEIQRHHRQKVFSIISMALQKLISLVGSSKKKNIYPRGFAKQGRESRQAPTISLFNEPSKKEDKKQLELPLPNIEARSASNYALERDEWMGTEDYQFPPASLLDEAAPRKVNKTITPESLNEAARMLEQVLEEFSVSGEIINVRPGPVVTLFELKPAAGIKTSRVIGLADDIARSMSALSARIAVIPGRNVIGIELPNPQRETVYLRELLLNEFYEDTSSNLSLILGKDIGGEPVIVDLSRMPHLLVAGTTGSGKSVAINTMILSLTFRLSPEQCKFIMIDPKMLELSVYDGIPHLLAPVVTDPKKAVVALKWAVREMENRYRAMSKLGVRNIEGYNTRVNQARSQGEILMRRVQTGFDSDSGKPVFENQPLDLEALPYIVIIVDEMADLMLVAGKDIESAVQRLAQMARAAGIHLIMATQRPSVDVITGTIKANFPTRISFQVTSKIDSRTILGEQGAEQLLGQGDMLYMAGGGRVIRVHGPYVRDDEVERVVKFLKAQGDPVYVESITEDPEDVSEANGLNTDGDGDELYQQAVDLVVREGKASTSFIQRHLQIGYNRAARIVDQMEKEGLISAANHVGKREVLR